MYASVLFIACPRPGSLQWVLVKAGGWGIGAETYAIRNVGTNLWLGLSDPNDQTCPLQVNHLITFWDISPKGDGQFAYVLS